MRTTLLLAAGFTAGAVLTIGFLVTRRRILLYWFSRGDT